MVRRRSRKAILALGALCLGLASTEARAQLFGGPQMPPSGGAALVGATPTASNGLAMGMYGNPYMNPSTNPYMNPFLMSQMTGTQANPALYLFAAQQMNGGVLSGRIGGPKAANPTAKPATSPASLSDSLRPTGANTPGATASRYFNRTTPASTGTARYYSRPSKHYPNNGR